MPARPVVKKVGTNPSLKPVTRPSSASLRAQRQILLYIEDEDENWNLARLRLGDRYDLVRAVHAGQACEFAAILMDIELPGSELVGVEFAALDIPVIFVSAHGDAAAQNPELGSARVIRKPIDFNALNIAIAQAHLERVMSRGPHRS
jgi:CheY-like chemotaxis protein